MEFELGQSVIVWKRRRNGWGDWKPWGKAREGRVSAVAAKSIRVRWAGFALRQHTWLATDDDRLRIEHTREV